MALRSCAPDNPYLFSCSFTTEVRDTVLGTRSDDDPANFRASLVVRPVAPNERGARPELDIEGPCFGDTEVSIDDRVPLPKHRKKGAGKPFFIVAGSQGQI